MMYGGFYIMSDSNSLKKTIIIPPLSTCISRH